MKTSPPLSPGLPDLVHHLTAPCADNGREFTAAERISRIKSLHQRAGHQLSAELPLALVYRHPQFNPGKPAVLVSSHIDSLYTRYHSRLDGQTFLGTYDNSITNAAVAHLILTGTLHPQVLVAFTGDEERGSRGASQVVEHLSNGNETLRPELVVVLDVTEEAYDSHPVSFENLFAGDGTEGGGAFGMKHRDDLLSFIPSIPGMEDSHIVPRGEADESWQYASHDLNCLALCLPIQTITGNMHDDEGVHAKLRSLEAYTEIVGLFTNAALGHMGVPPSCG
jgi:hypothetical protein